MDVVAVWKNGLSFDAAGSANGLQIPLGEEEGFRPMEVLLVALAGCTGMDVISILRKKRQDVNGFEVRVHGATGHMGAIRERDGAITKMAHLIRSLVYSQTRLAALDGPPDLAWP